MQSPAEQNGKYSAERNAQLNRTENGKPVYGLVCQCQVRAPSDIYTSWGARNPGRRYYRCANRTGDGRCGFFQWIDQPWEGQARRTIATFQIAPNARMNQIIGELERTKEELSNNIRAMDRRCKSLTEELDQKSIEGTELLRSVKKKNKLLLIVGMVVIISMIQQLWIFRRSF